MQAARGGVRVDGQQHERSAFRRVRGVDAGRCADEPVARLGDDEVAAAPNDASRFREHDGELLLPGDDAALRLRDDLVRDDEDVALLEGRGGREQPGEVVPRANLREARDRDDAQLAQGRPVTRSPACVL
jgi:hypothetical protein